MGPRSQSFKPLATVKPRGSSVQPLAYAVALLVALACGMTVGLGGLLAYELTARIVVPHDG